MSSTTGECLRLSLFGQSHGEAVGVVLDGLPAGIAVDMTLLQAFLDRRAPGRSPYASARREADIPRFVSGIVNGKTCGAPICALIENRDARPADYAPLRDTPRPGTADFPARLRYGDDVDLRGSGHFSGRLTVALCTAGAIALQALDMLGVTIGAHIAQIGPHRDTPFDPVETTEQMLRALACADFPAIDPAAVQAMRAAIDEVAAQGDSIGGVVECCALGLPVGLGSPVFGGVENRLSAMLFGIPAVRGVSFGDGFDAASMRGSAHNDEYFPQAGQITMRENHHGGVLGGMTTGMPLLLRVAFKPTPSIARPQQTVRFSTAQPETISIQGRHDPCIALRAVPCVEAAVALVLLDLLLAERGSHAGCIPPGN